MNASLPQGKTRRALRALLSAGILVFAVACNEEDSMAGSFKDDLPQSGDARLVYDVTEISVEEVPSAAMQVAVTATGHTRTGGWTDMDLVLDEDASTPENPVYRFVAVPPTGMATQMITPIDATTFYVPAVETVTVVAETNSITVEYHSASWE